MTYQPSFAALALASLCFLVALAHAEPVTRSVDAEYIRFFQRQIEEQQRSSPPQSDEQRWSSLFKLIDGFNRTPPLSPSVLPSLVENRTESNALPAAPAAAAHAEASAPGASTALSHPSAVALPLVEAMTDKSFVVAVDYGTDQFALSVMQRLSRKGGMLLLASSQEAVNKAMASFVLSGRPNAFAFHVELAAREEGTTESIGASFDCGPLCPPRPIGLLPAGWQAPVRVRLDDLKLQRGDLIRFSMDAEPLQIKARWNSALHALDGGLDMLTRLRPTIVMDWWATLEDGPSEAMALVHSWQGRLNRMLTGDDDREEKASRAVMVYRCELFNTESVLVGTMKTREATEEERREFSRLMELLRQDAGYMRVLTVCRPRDMTL
ncbi:unnamed protein product [Vitrella brassicaformis CCMP3155]|uniref:Secreted protein n=1 Tax=Vitrella brassicaformis (strain CCMP3155) TaxID=1169540 RepID=A0A0G4FF73_VITBC|nr:unnamed protein product [Vitrella brassicaformis CCMP3155]|eukprot:CEM11845.1 unnamed protein product [Vitrella brassicaformis CCMP3155]